MKQYKDLVNTVLNEGIRKNNRTGVDTIMYFGYHYKVDLAAGFPLLTTKKIFFNSVIRELLWYLNGETHIRNLRQYLQRFRVVRPSNSESKICTLIGGNILQNHIHFNIGSTYRSKNRGSKVPLSAIFKYRLKRFTSRFFVGSLKKDSSPK